MSLSDCYEYSALRPAVFEIWAIARDAELLKPSQMAYDIRLIVLGVMVPCPVLRVYTTLCIIDHIVDKDAAVVAFKQDLNRLVLLPGHIIKVVALAEFVDLERSPYGVLKQYDRFFMQNSNGLFEFMLAEASDGYL